VQLKTAQACVIGMVELVSIMNIFLSGVPMNHSGWFWSKDDVRACHSFVSSATSIGGCNG